jgi:hypothetical protein
MFNLEKKRRFGQQTPRRWGWGTPLKKRTATRIKSHISLKNYSQLSTHKTVPKKAGETVATHISSQIDPLPNLHRVCREDVLQQLFIIRLRLCQVCHNGFVSSVALLACNDFPRKRIIGPGENVQQNAHGSKSHDAVLFRHQFGQLAVGNFRKRHGGRPQIPQGVGVLLHINSLFGLNQHRPIQ